MLDFFFGREAKIFQLKASKLYQQFQLSTKGVFFQRNGLIKTFCLVLFLEKYILFTTILARSAPVPASCHKIPYFKRILNVYNLGYVNYQDSPP